MADTRVQEALRLYVGEAKFAPGAWERRGLNPSNAGTCRRMEAIVNDMATKLLELSQNGAAPSDLRQSLASSLRSVRSIQFDTEEREFICDEVARLGRIVNVNVSNTLNRWHYGLFLGTLLNLFPGVAKTKA